MGVDRIYIENYKGIRSTKVEFHPQINIFIGNNASGKTTLLKAIGIALSNITSKHAGRVSSKELMLKDEDINHKANYSVISAEISDFLDQGITIPSDVFRGHVSKELLMDIRNRSVFYSQQMKAFDRRISVSPVTIPIFKFYPAYRSVNRQPKLDS